jgi:PfaB family protein
MERVAIIGMACLFPGARTPAEFWENLEHGRSTTSAATAAEMVLDPAQYYDPVRGRRDRYYSIRGGFVRDVQFDPTGYALPAAHLAGLDVVFQWPLAVARDALRDAGYADAARRPACGVVLGNLSFPTRRTNLLTTPIYRSAVATALRTVFDEPQLTLRAPGDDTRQPPLENMLVAGQPAGVIANALELHGPTLALDAACASSLYSVKLACRFLEAGQADLMLAGAVSAADPFFIHMGFSIFQAYPGEDAASRPLDRASRGLYSGEGAGMLVLKRYRDALRDGDRVYAVIEGLGLSNDGRGKHPLTPNPRGQRLAFERAYAEAGIDPATIDYVECHATGTPIGDITELNSMEAFFAARGGRPLIGSVKANFGHLLTAAGMASIIKVVLSMAAGRIPGTINISDPLVSQGGLIGGERIVRQATAWPDRGGQRRAGINAFGFGGTNAHLVLSSPPVSTAVPPPVIPRPLPLAIVGMDALFGPADTLEAFGAAIAAGVPQRVPLPASRWKGIEADPAVLQAAGLTAAPAGSYIDDFEFDFLHYRHPPNPADQPIAQQLLALKVADRALRDAGMREGGNVAVLMAMATELALHQFRGRVDLGWQIREALERHQIALSADECAALETIAQESVHEPALVNQYTSFIGNIMASRVASLWDFSGPALTISAERQSVVRAIEVARLLLSSGDVDAVVIGAVDLAGGVEHVLLRQRQQPAHDGAAALSLDATGSGWLVGEGAGAIVLRRRADATAEHQRIYAVIEGIGTATGADRVAQAAQAALHDAGRTADELGLLELSADGVLDDDREELRGLRRIIGPGAPRVAVGSVKAIVGHGFAAAPMASIIKVALSLAGRSLPVAAGLQQPRDPADWQGAAWSVPAETRPWLQPGGAPRVAALGARGDDGSYAQLVLAEAPGDTMGRRAPISCDPPVLLPLVADAAGGFDAAFDDVLARLAAAEPLDRIASHALAGYAARAKGAAVLALAGRDAAELRREIALARESLADARASGSEWRTPSGSCYAAQPLGTSGEIAFVYPGGASVALGAGRDLLLLFPELHDDVVAAQIDGDLIYPPSIGAPEPAAIEAAKRRLRGDLVAMLRNSAAFALLATRVLREQFGIAPHSALGYSMGEGTMLLALGAWPDVGELAGRLRESPLFHTTLAGRRREAARTYLGAQDAADDFWGVYLVRAPAERVAAALRGADDAFVTLINTPGEVIVAGASASVEQRLTHLGVEWSRAPFDHVLHAPPAAPWREALAEFHTLPVADVADVRFYSTTSERPLELTSAALANAMAGATVEPFDFVALVERVYHHGARLFVELGPGAACTRWIDGILGARPHAAIAIDERGDGQTGLVRAVARLLAHGVPIAEAGLARLNGLDRRPAESAARGGLTRRVATGGHRIIETIATPAHRARFGAARRPATPVAPARPALPARVASPPQGAIMPPRIPGTPPATSTSAHAGYLAGRSDGLRHLADSLRHALRDHTPAQASLVPAAPAAATRSDVIWDEADLVEFAEGAIANVFGPAYADIDRYPRRVRLPTFPYLLVSRVTRLEGQLGQYRPCSITTEYDIPVGAWYTVDGQIPWAISVESGQCDLLLISWLGIDFENRGDRVYRLLDCTLTFLTDLAREGDTLRYDIRITSFARSGQSLLFFFNYDCYVGDTLVLTMINGCAGFFSDDELAHGRGVIFTDAENQARANAVPRAFAPPLECRRTSFGRDDLLALSAGEHARAFGPAYLPRGRNPSLRLPPEAMLMIDRITDVDRRGGAWGLGLVLAVKDLHPDDWYFPCHFKDDQVLAGSLQAEGCGQLLQFYMLLLGLQATTVDARFQPIFGLPQVVRCRGQVLPQVGQLVYRMEVTDIGLTPHPFVRANVEIWLGDRMVVFFRDLGLQLIEKA